MTYTKLLSISELLHRAGIYNTSPFSYFHYAQESQAEADDDKRKDLATLYPHPLDKRIKFFPEGHIYIIDDDWKCKTSVSTVWGYFFESFNPVCLSDY